jgi:hypothetical protein
MCHRSMGVVDVPVASTRIQSWVGCVRVLEECSKSAGDESCSVDAVCRSTLLGECGQYVVRVRRRLEDRGRRRVGTFGRRRENQV